MKRNISVITLNQFLTNAADSIFNVILFWYVYSETGSALSASFVTAISFIVQILIAPIMGVLSDRYNPRKCMQISFVILGLLGIIFAPIYFYFDFLILPFIYFAIIVHTASMMLETSSKNRLIPQFVDEEHIIKTNGYISSSGNVAALLGNSIGGIMLTFLSFAGVMLVHSGLYFLAGALLLLVRARHKENNDYKIVEHTTTEKNKMFTELIEGFKLIKNNQPLLKLIILSCVLNISMLNSSLLVVLVSDQYNGTSATFGLFNMFGVLSSILIGLVISRLTDKFSAPFLFTAGLLFCGLSTILIGFTDMITLGIILNMVILASLTVLRIAFNSFLMIFVEDKFRGRIMSLAIALSAIVVPVVSLLGGYLSDKYSVSLVYLISGGWIVLWTIFPLVDKDIKSIKFNKKLNLEKENSM